MFRHDGTLLRAIFQPAMDDFAAFEASGLREKLVTEGRLVAHADVDVANLDLSSWPTKPERVIAPTELPGFPIRMNGHMDSFRRRHFTHWI